MVRPRLAEIWTLAPLEECQLHYPAHLTMEETEEMAEWLTSVVHKLKRHAERRAAPAVAGTDDQDWVDR